MIAELAETEKLTAVTTLPFEEDRQDDRLRAELATGVAVTVIAEIAVAVGDAVSVPADLAVAVAVAVGVLVGVSVGVFVAVLFGVDVAVLVGALVGVFVTLFAGVAVEVFVGVLVAVFVAVFVAVAVAVFVAVAVAVGGIAQPVATSCEAATKQLSLITLSTASIGFLTPLVSGTPSLNPKHIPVIELRLAPSVAAENGE